MTVLLKKLPVFKKYLMYASRGPVLKNHDIVMYKKLIEEIEPLKNKYNAFALIMDPEINDEKKNECIKSGFKIQENDEILIQPKHNMIIKLKDFNEEELFKTFSEKTRYNVRLATRKGVTVRYSNNVKDLESFYELYKITALRDKIGMRPFEYFKRMLDAFNDDEIRIYVAEHEGEVLSAAITLNYGKKLFYVYGASSNNKRNLMHNYIMQWEMIKYALETKCLEYDFGGVFNFTHEDGLYKFKSGFCKKDGVTKHIGEITKIYNKPLYFMYSEITTRLHKFKKKIRKIIRR